MDRRARLLSTTLPRRGGNPWDLAAMAAAARPGGIFAGDDGHDDNDSDDEMGGLGPNGSGGDAPQPESNSAAAPAPVEGIPSAEPDYGYGDDRTDGTEWPANHPDDAPVAGNAHVSSYEELCRLRIVREGACAAGVPFVPSR